MTPGNIYSYSGMLAPNDVPDLIRAISFSLKSHHVPHPVYTKIISVSIEALQNQTRHGEWVDHPKTSLILPSYTLRKRFDSYTVTSSNFIRTSEVSALANKLHLINTLTHAQLISRFRDLLKQNAPIKANGAGLGLLEMRRKSGTNLTFTFQERTHLLSLFNLTITLPRSDQNEPLRMKPLTIQQTEHTPTILFDQENNRFEITGRSFMDDPLSFYTPVLAWLQDYAQHPNASTEMVISLEFYNTETGKYLYDLLSILERIKGAKVTWQYAEQDRDMEESGLDYAELVNIPFEFKMY